MSSATHEENWDDTLFKLTDNFFSTQEAKMLVNSKFMKGAVGYAPVPLSEDNNRDVWSFWCDSVEQEQVQGRQPT